jgi:predicted nuclease of predicted toxin-antitoxin system
MARTLRFHLDENCPTAIADGLRRRGIDVTTTSEAGLLTESDEEQIAYARTEGRLIFTQDEDFLRMNAAGVPHAGIAYFRQGARSLGEIIQA